MILIQFSSGLDSTTLVYQALEKKEKFRVCYINIKNNVDKTKIEIQQRKKILSMFKTKYGVSYISDNQSVEISLDSNKIISLPQIPAWIMGLLYSVDKDIKEVRMGYCMNDDAISYIQDLKKIWNSYQSICDNKLPKLAFPLTKKKKKENYYSLPDEIFQETFFCENPTVSKKYETDEWTWKDCKDCGSCKRAIYDGTFKMYNRNQKNINFAANECAEPMEKEKFLEKF